MGYDYYSQLKVAWHPDRIRDFRMHKRPQPLHVHFVISDLCNQDCSFCAYRISNGLSNELFAKGHLAGVGTNNPKRQIPTPKAMSLLEEFARAGVKAVQFTGGGEPTAHVDHLTIMRRAQTLGMETSLVTNGLRMIPMSDVTLKHQWIRVSIDAGSADMYAAVRRVPKGHWAKVWSNIASLASLYKGTLGIGYVVTPDNYLGIEDAARMAKASGVGNMRVGAVFSTSGLTYYCDRIQLITEHIQEVKARVDSGGFELIDLFGRRLHDLEAGAPTEPHCYYQYLTLYVGADLNLYRCCNTAYTTAGLIGNLGETPLEELLLRYEPFDARSCRFCQFTGQNKAIASLVRKPTHVNFV